MLKTFRKTFCIGACLVIFLTLSYLSFMYIHTAVQLAFIPGHITIFEEAEEHAKTVESVEEAVGCIVGILIYYPGGQFKMIDNTPCESLLETLRRNSVKRIVAVLKERFPESNKGDSPAAWIEAYGDNNDKLTLNAMRASEWYKKWYACLELSGVSENSEYQIEREND